MRNLLLTLSLVALVACNKRDESVNYSNGDIINLQVTTNNIETKASLVESASDISDLGLYCAMHTNSSSWSTSTTFAHTNISVSYDETTDEWGYDNDNEVIYWDWVLIDDKYTFMSYSPFATSANNIVPKIVEGNLTVEFEVKQDVTEQIDLMIAQPIMNTLRPSGGQISLDFYHALSALSFELVGDYESVKSITIQNLYDAGTAQYNSSDDKIEWSLTGSKNEFTITRAQIESGEYLLMIPQSITSDVKFIVNLTDNTSVDLTTTLTLEAGYKYVFTVYVGADIAFGGIQVDLWIDAETLPGGSGGGSTSVYAAYPRPVSFTANSYMIHPSDGFDSYYIDVNSQINYFWDKSNGYVTADYSEYIIDDDDIAEISSADYDSSTANIKAEVLWNTTGNSSIVAKLTTSEFAMKESVTALSAPDFTTSNCTVALKLWVGGTKAEGNIVVAVKKNGVILWSWHFWITDYNPDLIASESTPTDNQYVYTYAAGSDGAVHRYKDGSGVTLWGTGGDYADKFIMDRNLGALDAGAGTEDNTLLYQFGRKDPFPYNDTYTTKSDIHNSDEERIKSFADAVSAPTVFYYYSDDGDSSVETNWCNQNTGDEYLWNDYYVLVTDNNEKSLFDPSPMGWQVVVDDTCSDFSDDNFVNKGSYHCYTPTGSSTTSTIYFPYSGHRNYYKGLFDGFGSSGYIRSSRAYGVGNSRYLGYFTWMPMGAMNGAGYSRTHGIATRVVQYNADL